jgi:hypothetical protein
LDECLNTNSMTIENTRRHIIPLLNKAHTYVSRLPHLQQSSRIAQHEYLIPDHIQPLSEQVISSARASLSEHETIRVLAADGCGTARMKTACPASRLAINGIQHRYIP